MSIIQLTLSFDNPLLKKIIFSYYSQLVLKCCSNVYFYFMFECSRWGPTSLQTVKMNECEFYTVCTQLGAGNIKLKHTLLDKRQL